MPIRLIWISRRFALPTSPKRKRLAAKGARIIGLFLLLALSLSLVTAGAAFGTTASGGKISSARLTQKKLTKFEVRSVWLNYKFSKMSTHFSYELQIKKIVRVKKNGTWRKVTSWKVVKTVKKRGHFKGQKAMRAKQLFGGKAVNVGSYRVKLSADRGSRTLSFTVIKAKKMTQVSAGSRHTCALRSNGTVWCWGFNEDGELGNDEFSNTMIGDIPTPVEVPGISSATQVSAGGDIYGGHSCALLSDGRIKCWGVNDYGQLGNGSTAEYGIPTPVDVKGISTATQIAAGGDHSCALLSDGTVRCWGWNEYGQLGDGTTDNSPTPVEVNGISTAIQIAAGGAHTCAVLFEGKVECWGVHTGQLGDGTTDNSPMPVEVKGISTASQIATGGRCILLSDGEVECWGYNNWGQLGNGTTEDSPTPVEATGIWTATGVAAGGNHTCARLSGGKVECWGANTHGQLGDGASPLDYDWINRDPHPIPIKVKGISTATHITAGEDHTCALLSGGRVMCWGSNNDGQLGDGTHYRSSTPVEVRGM